MTRHYWRTWRFGARGKSRAVPSLEPGQASSYKGRQGPDGMGPPVPPTPDEIRAHALRCRLGALSGHTWQDDDADARAVVDGVRTPWDGSGNTE